MGSGARDSQLGECDCAVIGIGRLGLCFGLVLEQLAGQRVIGVDVNPDYVAAINTKALRSDEPEVEGLLQEAVTRARTLFILVQTPATGGDRYYDHSYLANVLSQINALQPSDKHIVIGCTVMPGFINQIGRFLLSDCKNTSLSYNPAFVAQGEVIHGYRNGCWGMVLLGADDNEAICTLSAIYKKISEGVEKDITVRVMSPESAEICKLASNCFRTLKISFANMIGDLADRTPNADADEICAALGSDASIGKLCLNPGYGYGGPCYPRDNLAFEQFCKSVSVDPAVPRAAHDYNHFHHEAMASELIGQDKEFYEFEDVGYKPNLPVPMINASPKLIVAEKVVRAGKRVVIKDRQSVIIEVMKEYGSTFEYKIKDGKQC